MSLIIFGFLSKKQLNSCGDEFHIGDIAEPLPCGYTLKGTIPCKDICKNYYTQNEPSEIYEDLSDDEDFEGSGSGDFVEEIKVISTSTVSVHGGRVSLSVNISNFINNYSWLSFFLSLI